MIQDVSFQHSTYAPGHRKFEAGTPNVIGAIGLHAAIDYIQKIGLSTIASYEKTLTDYAIQVLSQFPNIEMIGMPKERVSVVSFVLKGIPKELITYHLDLNKIALRIGHHCAIPTVRFFGHEETIRTSFAFYNTKEEIDQLAYIIRTIGNQVASNSKRSIDKNFGLSHSHHKKGFENNT